ncbi:MAG: hypothetical protein J6S26_02590 [Solobacterium sp.]|nr:hypothetical protein [Solobacterium sp.]
MSLLGIAALAGGTYLYMIAPSFRKAWLKEYRNTWFAHRGLYDNQAGIPENSRKAFQRAIDHGYGMEMDVELSKDGVPVVFHDFTLERMARDERNDPVYGKVSDYPYEKLKTFHLLDTEETIPSFEQFLDLVNGQVPLIVELKAETGPEAIALCRKADELLQNYHGKYVVESFHPAVVQWYRNHRPKIIRGQLSEQFTKDPSQRKLKFFCMENLLLNFAARPDFIAYNSKHQRNLSRRIARRLYGAPSVAWTIQSRKELEAMKGYYDLFIFEGFAPETNVKQ